MGAPPRGTHGAEPDDRLTAGGPRPRDCGNSPVRSRNMTERDDPKPTRIPPLFGLRDRLGKPARSADRLLPPPSSTGIYVDVENPKDAGHARTAVETVVRDRPDTLPPVRRLRLHARAGLDRRRDRAGPGKPPEAREGRLARVLPDGSCRSAHSEEAGASKCAESRRFCARNTRDDGHVHGPNEHLRPQKSSAAVRIRPVRRNILHTCPGHPCPCARRRVGIVLSRSRQYPASFPDDLRRNAGIRCLH